jgi:hypothetical protein
MNEQELTDLFARLGARDPAGWAHSQINEGFPQLARFLFLRQAWKQIVAKGDTTWIGRELQVNVDEPGGAIGPALKRLLAQGSKEGDLTTVVRVMQWQLLFSFCYLLEDPGDVEVEVKDIAWSLFQTDEAGRPIAPIVGLHESVLETEPSGREMRA